MKDNYVADGFENRANDRNGVSDQIVQIKDNIRKVEADYVKTTKLEAEYITASEIEADYATIQSLSTVDGKIDNLTSIAITTQNLSAQNISANQINAGTLSVNYLDVNGIVNAMAAKNLSVQALTATGVVTLGGKMCYWQDTPDGFVLMGSSE